MVQALLTPQQIKETLQTIQYSRNSGQLKSKGLNSSFQPQSTIPDVFLWLLRGTKRLAYVRIPAHSIFFSLVEEQRGRNCGRVTTFYIKVATLRQNL